ncbi:hypothetical protein [Tunturiibacter psychrotolerans]|uniref:hypothetical protein n=1 Tax=Tunturiibacter psychrotolerans TaxID=3069686 RepID=UPI003D1B6D81
MGRTFGSLRDASKEAGGHLVVNWEAVQAVATAALVVTSAGAISYAGLQLRHERDYRAVENLEKQLSFFLSEKFVSVRQRLAESRLEGDELKEWTLEEPPVSAFEVLDFYEHLSLLVKKGHLDVYDVWHTFYEWAQPVYVDMQRLIESEESAYTEHYRDLQKMMRQMDEIQMDKMQTQKGEHWALWTPERIIEHYRYELKTSGRPRRVRRRHQTQVTATRLREDA